MFQTRRCEKVRNCRGISSNYSKTCIKFDLVKRIRLACQVMLASFAEHHLSPQNKADVGLDLI